jgi:hypothetical protein
MIGCVRKRPQDGTDRGHPTEASRVDLEQRRPLLDGHLLHRDLLDAAALGEPPGARRLEVERPVAGTAV